MLRPIILAIALGCAVSACKAEPVPTVAKVPESPEKRLEHPAKREYEVSVTSVYDGDTFKFNMPGLPTELNPLSVRLRGVDTPERAPKAKCAQENERAMAARKFTLGKINETGGKIIVRDLKWDKYGGRVDADVFVGKNREFLTELLIKNGYGRSYNGGKRTLGWCN